MRVTGWRCAVCAAEVDIATLVPVALPELRRSTIDVTSCRS